MGECIVRRRLGGLLHQRVACVGCRLARFPVLERPWNGSVYPWTGTRSVGCVVWHRPMPRGASLRRIFESFDADHNHMISYAELRTAAAAAANGTGGGAGDSEAVAAQSPAQPSPLPLPTSPRPGCAACGGDHVPSAVVGEADVGRRVSDTQQSVQGIRRVSATQQSDASAALGAEPRPSRGQGQSQPRRVQRSERAQRSKRRGTATEGPTGPTGPSRDGQRHNGSGGNRRKKKKKKQLPHYMQTTEAFRHEHDPDHSHDYTSLASQANSFGQSLHGANSHEHAMTHTSAVKAHKVGKSLLERVQIKLRAAAYTGPGGVHLKKEFQRFDTNHDGQ